MKRPGGECLRGERDGLDRAFKLAGVDPQADGVAVAQPAKLQAPPDQKHLVLLANVPEIAQVATLVLAQPQGFQDGPVGRAFHMQKVEIANVGAGLAAAGQGIVDHGKEVGQRDRIQAPLHPLRIGHVDTIAPRFEGLGGERLNSAAGGYDDIKREGPIGDDARAQQVVARVAAAQDQRAAAATQADQEARAGIGVIHQIAVAVAAGNQHRLHAGVGGHQPAGEL